MNLSHIHEKVLRPDSKGRISLGRIAEGVSSYKATYDDITHKVTLEPYTEVPLQEKWLYENKEALRRVQKGIQESLEGKTKHLGSFAKYIEE